MSTHYSTTSFLGYCLNHYFYGGVHYTWAAGDFYPYGQKNPKSSNPLLIYTDIYQPWKDKDKYDKFIAQHRLNLRKGVIAKQKDGTITAYLAKKLKRICDKVEVAFFYPIVYRIDTSKIPASRITTGGSAAVGSSEVRIDDLAESEFEILFLDGADPDFAADADCSQLKTGAVGDASFARPILEGRC